MEEIIWKDIPGYIDCQASNKGFVRVKNKDDAWFMQKPHETRSTSGTYLNYNVKNYKGEPKIRGAHQLVCLAFIEKPVENGEKYEVNHKDGNKHNNKPNNLEWVTRKQNIIHSLLNGLRRDNVELEVQDLLTGNVDKYISVSEFLNVWKISRHSARMLIARHQEEPFLNRWLFKANKTKEGLIKRPSYSDIICKDYVDNKTFITSNAAEMTNITKVKSVQINQRVGQGITKTKYKDTLINGYVFRHLLDTRPWPFYTKEEALKSRNKYSSISLKIKPPF